MNHRPLGSTGYEISEIGFGTWKLGGAWGDVTDEEGRAAIAAALDEGVTFLDTSDVYGDGRSERLIREVLDERAESPTVATKAGRRLDPHEAAGYTLENLRGFVDRSREKLGRETLDLLQLHCPPTDTYYLPETFDALDVLAEEGRIAHHGVSVERIEEGLKAMEYPGVETVQVVFNPFRQRPAERLFAAAEREDVGVIVRVPLASGLLTGAIDADDTFPENDHRNFNREGEAFDVGETFAGVPLAEGVAAVEDLEGVVPEELTLAQFALRWILDFDAVSTVIPGSASPDHIAENVAASEADPLSHERHGAVRDVYEDRIASYVHQRW